MLDLPTTDVPISQLPLAAAELERIAGALNAVLDSLNGRGNADILDRGIKALRKLESLQRALYDKIENGER
jgi:hypothetical protein